MRKHFLSSHLILRTRCWGHEYEEAFSLISPHTADQVLGAGVHSCSHKITVVKLATVMDHATYRAPTPAYSQGSFSSHTGIIQFAGGEHLWLSKRGKQLWARFFEGTAGI